MPEVKEQPHASPLTGKALVILNYLLHKWYFLVLATLIGAGFGYAKYKRTKPTYTANISFVLSTDQRGGAGLMNLAAQLGFDAISGGSDNIFSGENIVELFKSRKLISSALLSEVDEHTHQTLLNLIAQKQFLKDYTKLGPFNKNPDSYTAAQKSLYRRIITNVSTSFMVFKKDKRLIVYILSTKSTDPEIAYYSSKLILDQTSKYFIETKTKVATSSVNLLKHEADSLARILTNTYSSAAAMLDRTYNLNPSISVQRSGAAFNQAKASAYAAAYSEVMRNLEIAKINLQKETPLYRIIDEPELPLMPIKPSAIKQVAMNAIICLALITAILVAFQLYKTNKLNHI